MLHVMSLYCFLFAAHCWARLAQGGPCAVKVGENLHGTIAADKPPPFGGLKGLCARRIRNNDARDGGWETVEVD